MKYKIFTVLTALFSLYLFYGGQPARADLIVNPGSTFTLNDATLNLNCGDIVSNGGIVSTDSGAIHWSGASTVSSGIIHYCTDGVLVSGSPAVAEPATTDSYDLALIASPVGNVEITATTDGECTVTSANPIVISDMSAQSVTVAAIDDALLEGDHICNITHEITASADTRYPVGLQLDSMFVAVLDDELAPPDPYFEIAASGVDTAVVEGGITDTYTLTSTSGSVFIQIETDGQCQVNDPNPFLIGSTPTTITVTAVDDSLAEGDHSCTITNRYSSFYEKVLVVDVTDNADYVTLTESNGSTQVVEGGITDSFDIDMLGIAPFPVTVSFTTDGQCDVTPAGAIFIDTTSQSFVVTAVDDSLYEWEHNCAITPTVGVQVFDDLVVAITDDEASDGPVVILPTDGSVSVEEGGVTDTYTVQLATIPDNWVYINIDTDGQTIVSPTSLTFMPDTTALDPQTVTITAVDDLLNEGLHAGAISSNVYCDPNGWDAPMCDPQFPNDLLIETLQVEVVDNDLVTVTTLFDAIDGAVEVSESGASSDSYNVSLSVATSGTVELSTDGQCTVTSPTTLSFDATNWDIPQTVTVQAIDDGLDEASSHTCTVVHTLGAIPCSNAEGVVETCDVTELLEVSVLDDDDPVGITVGTTPTLDEATTGTGSYVLTFNQYPTDDVTIGLSPDNNCTVTQVDFYVSPDDITWLLRATSLDEQFSTTNVIAGLKSAYAEVFVQAVDNNIPADSCIIQHAIIPQTSATTGSGDYSSGLIYAASLAIADAIIPIVDNDPGLVVSDAGPGVISEGSASYNLELALSVQPTNGVSVILTPDAACNITTPTTLNFTNGDWDVAQPITTQAAGLSPDELSPPPCGVTMSTTSSADPVYSAMADFMHSVVFVAPGAVQNNMQLWLKADTGISETDGVPVSAWLDRSANKYAAGNSAGDGQTSPTLRDNILDNINFNPTVEFDGASNGLDLGSDFIYSSSSGLTVFAVLKPDAEPDERNFVFDFGSYPDRGFGLYYADNALGIYSATASGGRDSGAIAHGLTTTPVIFASNFDFGAEQSAYLNGFEAYSDTITSTRLTAIEIAAGVVHSATQGPVSLGRQSLLTGGADRFYDGKLAEIIVYDSDLLPIAQNKIQSYLALKYGITLDSSIDYLDSVGNTIYPSGSSYSVYCNNIAGIGRDTQSGLNQPRSRSINPDSLVTVSGSGLADRNYLMWGNDDLALSFTSPELPVPGNRLLRTWKIAETGETGSVTVAFDTSRIPSALPTFGDRYMLLVDADGDFTDATVVSGTPVTENMVVFTEVNFADGDFFSLAMHSARDGDIDRNGSVEVVDAMLALRMAVGLQPLGRDSLIQGDVAPFVNGIPQPDGKMSAADAMMILRKALGLESW